MNRSIGKKFMKAVKRILEIVGFSMLGAYAMYASCETASMGCDRVCLEGFVNLYLEALAAHDPARLPLTEDARYTENGIELELGDGIALLDRHRRRRLEPWAQP